MHYRLTRPDVYGINTPCHTKPSGRQGYYTYATSPDDARRIIREREGFGPSERFDVQTWDGGDEHGKIVA